MTTEVRKNLGATLNFEPPDGPYTGMTTLTPAQRDALRRAEAHPQRWVQGDPRTLRALLDKGLVHVGYYGENADGADFGPILGPVDE